MKLRFITTVLIAASAIVFLTVSAVCVVAYYVIGDQKINSTRTDHIANTAFMAAKIRETLIKIKTPSPAWISTSDEIIFYKDDACNPQSLVKPVASSRFEPYFEDFRFYTNLVLKNEKLKQICEQLTHPTPNVEPLPHLLVFSTPHKFVVPLMLVIDLEKTHLPRLFAVSLDGLGIESETALQEIYSSAGGYGWRNIEGSEIKALTPDLEILKQRAKTNSTLSLTPTYFANEEAFGSFAPISEDWNLVSYGNPKRAWSMSKELILGCLWLVLGSFLLLGVFSRYFIDRISAILTRLTQAATQYSQGNFYSSLEIRGEFEFQTLQLAFNHMGKQISQILATNKEVIRSECETEITREVRDLLIPKVDLKLSPLNIYYRKIEAPKVGRDWWGAFPAGPPDKPNSRIALMIGDVAGAWGASALTVGVTQGVFGAVSHFVRSTPSLVDEPIQLLKLINSVLFQSSGGVITMSFLICVFDFEKHTLTISNAGHNWPYLITKNEDNYAIKSVGAASPVLGVTAIGEFEHQETLPWAAGSKLFLYTDGLINCWQKEQNLFDKKLLFKVLKENMNQPAQALIEVLNNLRNQLSASVPVGDDITMLVCTSDEIHLNPMSVEIVK